MFAVLSSLAELRENLRFADVLDIGVIAFCLYFGLIWLGRRTSWSVLVILGSLTLLYSLARTLDMYLTSTLFEAGFTLLLISLVLVFQEDIRRGFERVATWEILGRRGAPSERSQFLDTIIEAVHEMARQRIGALIVIRGHEALDRVVRGGVRVNGLISMPLLQSIFQPNSPGHDGAVIIDGERIVMLAVHLPLSENLEAVGRAGLRHTAALGLAERSDALVLAVSEERGTISIAENGQLHIVGPESELKERLEDFYRRTFPEQRFSQWRRWLSSDLDLKFASVFFAALLWLMFAYRMETIQRSFVVPMEYRNLPANWKLEEPVPTEARVTLSGSERAFQLLESSRLMISVDLSDVRNGAQQIALSDENLNNPPDLSVSEIEPRAVWLTAYEMVLVQLPVRPHFFGKLPDGLTLADVTIVPEVIDVQVPQVHADSIPEVRTTPISLSRIRQSTTLEVGLVIPDEARLPKNAPRNVRVSVRVQSQAAPPASQPPANGAPVTAPGEESNPRKKDSATPAGEDPPAKKAVPGAAVAPGMSLLVR